MQLHTSFDEQTLRRYHERNDSSFFYIYWQHEEIAYPASNWTDFGSIILGWWITAAINLFYGSKREQMLFMDGPFSIKIARKGTQLSFEAEELPVPCECSLEHFITELIGGVAAVITELKNLDVDPAGQKSLAIGIHALRRATNSE